MEITTDVDTNMLCNIHLELHIVRELIDYLEKL